MKQENSVALSSLALGELLRNRCAHALGTAGRGIEPVFALEHDFARSFRQVVLGIAPHARAASSSRS